jgi:hypothetical protein
MKLFGVVNFSLRALRGLRGDSFLFILDKSERFYIL